MEPTTAPIAPAITIPALLSTPQIVGRVSTSAALLSRWTNRPSVAVHTAFTVGRRPFTPSAYIGGMRDQYYEQLDAIVDDLVNLTGSVRRAVSDATKALLEADGNIAESVIAGDKDIDEATEMIEERALLLLATQQPVATDLRHLVAPLRMLTALPRLGDL